MTVHLIEPKSDQDAIAEAKARFFKRARDGFDGFEVWDRARFVYRYPEDSAPVS